MKGQKTYLLLKESLMVSEVGSEFASFVKLDTKILKSLKSMSEITDVQTNQGLPLDEKFGSFVHELNSKIKNNDIKKPDLEQALQEMSNPSKFPNKLAVKNELGVEAAKPQQRTGYMSQTEREFQASKDQPPVVEATPVEKAPQPQKLSFGAKLRSGLIDVVTKVNGVIDDIKEKVNKPGDKSAKRDSIVNNPNRDSVEPATRERPSTVYTPIPDAPESWQAAKPNEQSQETPKTRGRSDAFSTPKPDNLGVLANRDTGPSTRVEGVGFKKATPSQTTGYKSPTQLEFEQAKKAAEKAASGLADKGSAADKKQNQSINIPETPVRNR